MKIIITTTIDRTIQIADDKVKDVMDMTSEEVIEMAQQMSQSGEIEPVGTYISKPYVKTLVDGIDDEDNVLFQLVEIPKPEEATYSGVVEE